MAALFAVAGLSTAAPVPEYDMKAAYLYNFAAFTTWPSHTGNSVRLCILGKDRFGGALEGMMRNSIAGIHIDLSYLPNAQSAGFCQILFIDASERENVATILAQIDQQPILTVTDSLDIYQSGVMIGMFLENNRLSFNVNNQLAKNAKLTISSKLLRVAHHVQQ
jgi:hypothetical protein